MRAAPVLEAEPSARAGLVLLLGHKRDEALRAWLTSWAWWWAVQGESRAVYLRRPARSTLDDR